MIDRSRFRSYRYLSAGVVATTLVLAGTGIAQADTTSSNAQNPSAFRVRLVDNSVVVTLDNAHFDVINNNRAVAIRDRFGKVEEVLPLSYTLDGVRYPILKTVADQGRTLTLTPQYQGRSGVSSTPEHAPELKPVASPEEDALAQANFMNNLGTATSVGSIVGTIIGAIVGGLAGTVVALGSCLALLACLLVGAPIFITFATAGGVVGTVLAGGGALVSAGWDYVQTLQAAPGTSHYQGQLNHPHR